MLTLAFDTETTGFPLGADAAPDDPRQPYLVELACVLFDKAGNVVDSYENLVRPDGWTIPAEATRIHGITTEEATEYGVPLAEVVADFMEFVDRASATTAFKLDFDAAIIRTAIARAIPDDRTGIVRDWTAQFAALAQTCTMLAARDVLRLPRRSGHGFKNPNLGEAFLFFCGQTHSDAHSAMADALACGSVHLALCGTKRILVLGEKTLDIALNEKSPAEVAPQTPPSDQPFADVDDADAVRLEIRLSPGLWFESCGKLRDKENNIVPPTLNVFQWRMSDAYEWQRKMGKAPRQIALKPRRVGGTTMGAAISYHHMRNFPCDGCMMADTHDKSTALLDVYRTLAESDSFDWGAEDHTTGARRLELGHSTLMQKSAEAPKGTRGLTLQVSHNSEVAFWASTAVKSAEATNLSLRNALAGHPQTSGIEESTPCGSAGVFYGTWVDARWPSYDGYWKVWQKLGLVPLDPPDEGNGYLRVFAAWYEFPEYVLPLVHPNEAEDLRATLSTREKRGILHYHWTWEQIKWRRFTIKNKCGNDERKFDEEYAEDPMSCFLSSGSPKFDHEGLATLEGRANQLQPTPGLLVMNEAEGDKRVQFVPCSLSEAISLRWEEARPGCRYLIAVDTNSGKIIEGGKERDAMPVQVWRDSYKDTENRWHPPRLVARLLAGWRAEFKPTAALIDILSRLYGRCIVIVENNMGTGLIDYLRDLGVPLFVMKKLDTTTGKWTEELGWHTTEDSRPKIINALGDVIRESAPKGERPAVLAVDIACPAVIRECRTFVRNSKGKYEASSGCHDDEVMCAGIAVFNLESATLMREPARRRRGPSDKDQWTTTR